jgi:hypothetical protein
MKKRIETFFKWFYSYLAVAGLITFSLFILEESFQTTMFGTWPAQDAGDWHLVKQGTNLMDAQLHAMRTVNYVAGWVQPLAFFSYHHYAKAEDFYIKALRAKTLANCPECFVGEEVEIGFTETSKEYDGGKVLHHNGPITVISNTETLPAKIRGIVTIVDGKVVIHVKGK